MDSSLRSTPGLMGRIDKLRDDMIKHFQAIVGLAEVERTDRNSTALTQYQMQVETAALIRTAEDVQSLIRQLQEMWLFGQLNTLGDSKAKQQTDDNAKVVAGLLEQLAATQQAAPVGSTAATDSAHTAA